MLFSHLLYSFYNPLAKEKQTKKPQSPQKPTKFFFSNKAVEQKWLISVKDF